MPNWVTNVVKAENMDVLEEKLLRKPTQEELLEDSELTENDMIVDFGMLIPRPKDLDIIAGGSEWIVDHYGFHKEEETKQKNDEVNI